MQGKIPRGGETVLIVEDVEARSMMAQLLKQQGYKTLEAANGEEGLLLFDKYRQEVSLVVIDLVITVMNGSELTDLLMPLCSPMKVLYMSGYPNNPALQDRNLNAGTNFIPKPFSAEDLAIRVRKILDN